jgi:hypothetical protein
MRNRQRGVTLTGLIVGAIILIVLLLLAMKIAPPYLEFFNAKKLIMQISSEGKTSVGEIRQAFDLKASVNDVSTLQGRDLEVTKDGGEVVISFAYRKEIPLFANLGVYLDFAADSKGKERAP